jgi:CyaY protein
MRPTAHRYTRYPFDHRRILLTMPSSTAVPAPPATPLADGDYRRLSDAALAAIEQTIDRWLDEDVVDIDAQRTGGLLEMKLPNGSVLVVNTQPPLQEIWLAARSGGFHFRHVEGRWLDTRDSTEFFEALSRCASEQVGTPLHFIAG